MTKTRIASVLVILTILSNFNKTQPTKADSTSVTPAASATFVTILFSGLMVFHHEKDKPSYEVGILDTPSHAFGVVVDSVPIHDLPKGRSWILEIPNSSTSVTELLEVGHGGKRRPDSKEGQFDFSWIIDLESEEFHDKELKLKPGLLKPIIHLPNGRLYVRYKSIDLERQQGDNEKFSDFGFVPETLALEVELQKDQELVLRDARTGGKAVKLIQNSFPPPNSGYIVSFTNIRHSPSQGSDFRLYYKLFNVPRGEQFDFRRKEDNREHPYNKYPGYPLAFKDTDYKLGYKDTCCGMVCTKVLLGTRKKALE
ncbi:MAG: hypothetical protein ACREBG_18735 [Pyrinomonadaceae bacterium]